MNRSVNLLARLLGLAWVGVLAFALYPAGRPAATLLQAVAYGAAWLGMLGWALFEYSARAARYRRRWFPVLLGAIAAIMGAAPLQRSGSAGGVINMTRGLGTSFGVALCGSIYALAELHAVKSNADTAFAVTVLTLAGLAVLAAVAASARRIRRTV